MIHNETQREQFESLFAGKIFIYLRVGNYRGDQLGIIDDERLAPFIHVIPASIVCGERNEIEALARTLNHVRLRLPGVLVQDILSKQVAEARRKQHYQRYHDDLRMR